MLEDRKSFILSLTFSHSATFSSPHALSVSVTAVSAALLAFPWGYLAHRNWCATCTPTLTPNFLYFVWVIHEEIWHNKEAYVLNVVWDTVESWNLNGPGKCGLIREFVSPRTMRRGVAAPSVTHPVHIGKYVKHKEVNVSASLFLGMGYKRCQFDGLGFASFGFSEVLVLVVGKT